MRKYERITAIIVAGGGVVIMYYAWNTLKLGSIHVPDAGLMPFLAGAALTILGIVWTLILQWTKKREDEGPVERRLWQRPVLSLVLMVIYAWAIETLGYITSTLVFMVVWQKLIEHEKWVKTALVSLLGTLAMYVLFVYFLKVPIPQELFLR
ncbi:MAG: tripartite tricarboxylate transporter TctB family protein [Syntrophales bacterium LBB04]|nr:tripartite tricarboxylate transporter TctB family protein [Syntrophales bacterium LBB04]